MAVAKEGDGLDDGCCVGAVTRRGSEGDPLSSVLWGEAGLIGCCVERQQGCSSDATETTGANYFL